MGVKLFVLIMRRSLLSEYCEAARGKRGSAISLMIALTVSAASLIKTMFISCVFVSSITSDCSPRAVYRLEYLFL